MANGEAVVAHSEAPSSGVVSSPGHARYSRPAVIALLLVSVVAGIRAAGPAVAGRGPWRQDALSIGIGLWAALAGLEIVLAIRGRRSPEAGHLAATLRRMLHWLTAVPMVVIIAIMAVNLVSVKAEGNWLKALRGRGQPRGHPKRLPRLGAAPSADGSYFVYALIALIVFVALVICAVLISRMKARVPGGYAAGVAEDDSTELDKAVESGRTALRAVDDARAAIIACYVAMEGSLAGAGAARTAAETPDELLARAVASGLIHGPAAGRLTGLFYEARFSSHPLADAAKNDARQALDAISAELRSKRAARSPDGQPDAEQPAASQPDSTQHRPMTRRADK